MQTQTSSPIEQFFHAFETNASAHDTAAQVAHFADVFMAASPQGAQVVRVEDLALALPKKKKLFDNLGCRSTTLVALGETMLDTRYVMANTRWRMRFLRDQDQPQDVEVDSVYIVDTGEDPFKIVFYLANQDLMQVLKQLGIMQ